MKTEVISAINALDVLATAVSQAWTDQPFNTQIGQWNILPFTREDLAIRIRGVAEKLKAAPDTGVSPELLRRLTNLPAQLSWYQQQTLPQLGSGHLPQVVTNLEIILAYIEAEIPFAPLPDWEEVAKSNLIPRDLARRLRSLEARISQLAPGAEDLEQKVQRINEAHAAALDLPTDLQALSEARDQVENFAKLSRDAVEEAQRQAVQAVASRDYAATAEAEAQRLIKNIESAYSAATTAGLAASFTERAESLSQSTWLWVGLLLLALVAGAGIGGHRLAELQNLATQPSLAPQWIWMNAGMSLLAIAAPVWFAWLATRQISQRFRLAEDYAFKASVARAYEGYRREAARLDPELEARLFASALDRLEEAPLRFLSVEEHGSPYEALLASAGFQKALDKFPNLRDIAQGTLDRATAGASRVISNATGAKQEKPGPADEAA